MYLKRYKEEKEKGQFLNKRRQEKQQNLQKNPTW